MARDQIKQAVAYLRANDGSAAKLEAQRQRIAAWAATTETVIGSWHLEVGSGIAEMRHRPGLLKALAAIELGGLNVGSWGRTPPNLAVPSGYQTIAVDAASTAGLPYDGPLPLPRPCPALTPRRLM